MSVTCGSKLQFGTELQATIVASLKTEATKRQKPLNSKKLETIIVNGKFKK
jgi:hypothetical protein